MVSHHWLRQAPTLHVHLILIIGWAWKPAPRFMPIYSKNLL